MKFVLSTSMIIQLILLFLFSVAHSIALVLWLMTFMRDTFHLHDWKQWFIAYICISIILVALWFMMLRELLWYADQKVTDVKKKIP